MTVQGGGTKGRRRGPNLQSWLRASVPWPGALGSCIVCAADRPVPSAVAVRRRCPQ